MNAIRPKTKFLSTTLAAALLMATLGGAAPAIAATPTETVTNQGKICGKHFTDNQPGSNSLHGAIRWLQCEGVTSGYSDGSYGRTKPISRGETSAFLYRIAKPHHHAPPVSPFFDLETSHPFYDEVTWLVKKGAVHGYQDDTFRSQRSISRGELAKIVYRVVKPRYKAPLSTPFKDVKKSSGFYTAIAWMEDQGLVSGYADGTFRPSRQITRGEVAKVLQRAERLID